MSIRIGSLFSGYGGLDLGVQQVLGGTVAWHVEFDAAPSAILAHHWPDVPNYGDVTAVDWWSPEVERVDILTGGFPCQDVSLAGLRRGLKDGTRSGLWSEFARAIDALRPSLVVIENVRGLLSATADRQMESSPWGVGDRHDGPALRALGAVLGDLAELGYDAEWCGLRAADAGAPHGRYRVFVVAHPAGQPGSVGHGDDVRARRGAFGCHEAAGRGGDAADAGCRGQHGWSAQPASSGWRGRDAAGDDPRAAADPDDDGWGREDAVGRPGWRTTAAGRRGDAAANHSCARLGEHPGEPSAEEAGPLGGDVAAGPDGLRPALNWGPYRPAVERWERTIGRVAPEPTKPTEAWVSMMRKRLAGAHRLPVGMRGSLVERRSLSAEFVEWMMGLPAGHVTGAPITRAQQLKALGNGVVPQQAALAVRTLLEREAVAA